MIRQTSGFLFAPLPAERADLLDLPPMVAHTHLTVAVDAKDGVSTGISATDRARTARVLADPDARPADLVRPGHVLPVRVPPGGVIDRPGHHEAAVDLCRLAGLPPVALAATVVRDDGPVSGGSEVAALARRSGLVVVDVAEIVRHRRYYGDGVRPRVRPTMRMSLPTTHGRVRAITYHDELTGAAHLALLSEVAAEPVPLVHVQTGGDARLDAALATICAQGGVVVCLGGTKGFEAPAAPPGDDGAAAAMLADLDLTTIRLLPGTAIGDGLRAGGITVAGDRKPAPLHAKESL
jgi:3,4-dihydroxy 2-butanone 4-phosphate synthase/GTP cyclohydrolase II